MTNASASERSVLATLRSVIPHRKLHCFAEAKQIAELQANRLLEIHQIDFDAIPAEMLGHLPKVEIEMIDVAISGATFWNGRAWIIQINQHDSWNRQRFTLAHEYKHIIDHHAIERLYVGSGHATPLEQAEQAADYFAGCLLVPKKLLKRVYYNGKRHPSELAKHFQVSVAAIKVRLRQTGIAVRAHHHKPAHASLSGPWHDRLGCQSQLQGVHT